jgi:UrcA family protein
MTKSLTIFAAITSLAAAAPAFAADTTSRSVGFSDLNLATSIGRDVLDTRLERASRAVCGVGQSRELKQVMHASKCYRGSIAAARSAAETAIAKRAGATVEVAAR